MKIITTNFRKDEQGRSLMTASLAMGALDGYAADSIEGFSERLSQILPDLKMDKNAMVAGYGKGASIARLIAHISIALQSESGFPADYWQIESTVRPGTYDITFECTDEYAGEYACRAAFRILRSALYRQRYSVSPDINLLKTLKNNRRILAA